jgi:hypothetical protein
MCVQCGIYRVRAICDNRVQFRYVGHMRVRWDSHIGIQRGCKVEIVDIDESIDYWHQEGARGR